VKASRGSSWQFSNINQFCEIEFNGHQQIIGNVRACPVKRLVVVFVKIEDDGNDRFYILTWESLRDILIRDHKAYLSKHNAVRPKRWDSMHCIITEKELRPYQDQWDTIKKNLR
jgi:hypothetical protein